VSCLDEEQVVALLERRATAVERAGVDAHVADCRSCRALLAGLVSSLADLDGGSSPPLATALARWTAGTILNGRYTVLGWLGAGGMGRVYRVRDSRRPAVELALKTIAASSVDPQRLELLKTEFRTMAQLEHPNIARVHDFEKLAGSGDFAFTLELVEGVDLYSATENAPAERILELAVQACRALAYLHSRAVIHADFKPLNAMLDRSGCVKVLDFGLSGVERTAPAGTPAYMAPELARGAPNARSDLYAFGVTLFQLLCRRLPFVGRDLAAMRDAHLSQPLVFPDAPALDARLRAVLERLLAKKPEERYASGAEVIAALAAATGRSYLAETSETRRSYSSHAPLVGRKDELEALVGFCRRRAGGGADDDAVLATISGASGTGKSRLVRELRQELQLVGLYVVEATCYQGGAGELEPVRTLCDALRALLSAHVPELELPDLGWLGAERSGESGAADLAAEEGLQARRLRELADFVLDATDLVGLAIVVDDLQWGRTSTVEFLRLLCERQSALGDAKVPARLALVVAFRDDEVAGRPLAALVDSVRGTRRRSIALGALDEPETAELVAGMLGTRDLEPLGARVSLETGGNPFFVEEIVRTLMDRGDLFLEAGRWAARAGIGALELPPTIAAVLERRLAQLDPSARALMSWLAAYAQPMPLGVLAEAAGLSAERVAEGVGQLVEREIVVAVGPERAKLSHDRLREFIDERDERDERETRRARHRAIAGALDRLADAEGDYVFERAHHHWHAGDFVPAALWCERAATLAEHGFAIDVAIENHERVQIIAEANGDEPKRRAATDRLLELLAMAGRYQRLHDLAGAELAHRSEKHERARLELLRGEALGGLGRTADGLEHLHQATAALGGPVPRSVRGRRRFIVGHYLRHVGRLAIWPRKLVRELPLDPLERARRETLARSYLLMSNYFYFQGDDEGFGLGFAGMNTVVGLGPTVVSRKLVDNVALSHHLLGRRGLAERAIREAQRLAASDADRANVLTIEVLARQSTQRPMFQGQRPTNSYEDEMLRAIEVLSTRSKLLWANFARMVTTTLVTQSASAFRFRPELFRWAETMRGTVHGTYVQGVAAVMARVDGQNERAERALAEIDGAASTPFYRAIVDARVAHVWALTGDSERSLSALRAVRERLPTMRARMAASLWVPGIALCACVVLGAIGKSEAWVVECLGECVAKLHAARRHLPANLGFLLEVGRLALGGSSLAAIEKARARSRASWQEEQQPMAGHPDGCLAAALVLRASHDASLRAAAPALAEEAEQLISPRFPAAYVERIRALLRD
jgi:eukaryotic-like serine/threonine-protein kinase